MDRTLDDEPPAESKPKTKTKPSPKPSAATKSPAEWMAELRMFSVGPKMGAKARAKIPHWQHTAASALHGWKQHKHDANEDLKLTEADYQAALKAASKPPYMPHQGALSKYCKHEFRS